MRKLTPFLLICSIVLSLVACQKEQSIDTLGSTPGSGGSTGGGGNTSGKTEVGTWKFLSMRGITSSIVEFNDGVDNIKSVTLSDYTTINNTGTLKFDGSTMTSNGIGYSVDFIAKGYFYTNGTLDDSLEVPFSFTAPPTSATASYKKIGSDSIYVQSGMFTTGSGGTSQSSAGGYKLKFDGDKMTMTGVVSQSKLDLSSGVSQRTTNRAEQILSFQKQ
jgi:hypothetical protein